MSTINDDRQMETLLREAKTIAVVGHSDKPYRTSYQIANYLRKAGYKVIPVNPTVEAINGEKSYAQLADIPEDIDIVDVFRRSEHLDGVVAEAIASGAKSVWSQLGVVDPDAEKRANEANLPIVVDLCIIVEHRRLGI